MKKRTTSKMEVPHITKDMPIGEIMSKYPEVADVFMEKGLHCIGCHVSPYESLQAGASMHGMSEENIDAMVHEANEVISAGKDNTAAPDIILSKNAGDNILALMKKEKKEDSYLHIEASKEKKGFKYDFVIRKSLAAGDKVIESQGVKIACSGATFDLIKGSKITFAENTKESGLRIENPNEAK